MSTTINYTNDVSALAGLVSNLSGSGDAKFKLQQSNSPIQQNLSNIYANITGKYTRASS